MKPNSKCYLCGKGAFELAVTQQCATPECSNFSREFVEGLYHTALGKANDAISSISELGHIMKEATYSARRLGATLDKLDHREEIELGHLVRRKDSNAVLGYVVTTGREDGMVEIGTGLTAYVMDPQDLEIVTPDELEEVPDPIAPPIAPRPSGYLGDWWRA